MEDKFGDLTLTFARTEFNVEAGIKQPRYFDGGTAFFDGSVALTGWCSIAPEGEGYIFKRDIIFVPDGESHELPVINNILDENRNVSLISGMEKNFSWLGEYDSPIRLKNAEDYQNLDLSGFPADGTFVKVEVTIEGITCKPANSPLYARLVDIKYI